ncbi:MAG TPA: NUDIX hydrolase [Actinomycetota bacterium]
MTSPEIERVYEGPIFSVEILRWPGKRRDVVRALGASAVLPLTSDGHVILVRQEREAVGERLLEIPAGLLDVEGEPPLETARRELREETGHRAGSIEPLGRLHTSPGFVDEVCHLFLGTGCTPEGDPEEGMEVVALPLAEAVAMVGRGEITDSKTVAALLLAARR